MAGMSKTKYNEELNTLEQLVNAMILDESVLTPLKDAINVLKGRVGEIGTPGEANLLVDLNALKASIYDAFKIDDYHKILSQYYYAIDSADFFEIGRLGTQVAIADPAIKLECIKNYMAKFNEIRSKLKAAEIIDERMNIDIGEMSERKEKKFDKATDKAANALQEVEELQRELNRANARGDEKEVSLIIYKLDKQLKKLNSTDRTLSRLRKKVGHIGPHQRSIKVKTAEITALRNQEIADRCFYSPEIDGLVTNMVAAYRKQANATTATDLYRAKKEVKQAEKQFYSKRLTRRRAEKIDKAVAERKAIISRASSVTPETNHEYRHEMKKTLKQLKKVDKKIIGKRNANELYWGLKRKTGYLVGGTGITLPKQIVELDSSIRR